MEQSCRGKTFISTRFLLRKVFVYEKFYLNGLRFVEVKASQFLYLAPNPISYEERNHLRRPDADKCGINGATEF